MQISTRDALGAMTVFEYNAADKLIRQTDPEGAVVQYEYDTQG